MKSYKYKLFTYILVLIIGSVFISIEYKFNKTDKTYLDLPLIVCIDPGHGGTDGGAEVNGIFEKDINLSISLKLKEQLIKNNFKVLITRNDDYHLPKNSEFIKKRDLDERIKIINNASLFISIHTNKFSIESVNGAQVFYNTTRVNSLILASYIQLQFKKDFINKRVCKSINEIYLLDNVSIPGVIVEVGFMSNQIELENLLNENYQYMIANTITNGLISFMNYTC